MAWITAGYIKTAITTATYNVVSPSTAVFNQFEGSARSKVAAILQHAGYSSPGTALTGSGDATNFLRMLVAAQWCRESFGLRKGLKFPPAISDAFELLNAVYDKKLPIPGITPSTSAGYGGVKISPSTGSDARPQIFGRSKITGF